MASASKNNPDARGTAIKGKVVLSDDCEKCKNRCSKGIHYLEVFAVKHEGNGVFCKK